jgi:hypothetical protein
MLLGLKVPPHIVQAKVCHTNLDVTMTIYAHTSLEEQRGPCESWMSTSSERATAAVVATAGRWFRANLTAIHA